MSILELEYTPADSPTLPRKADFIDMCKTLRRLQSIPIEDVEVRDIDKLEHTIHAFLDIGSLYDWEADALTDRLCMLHRMRVFRQLIAEQDQQV